MSLLIFGITGQKGHGKDTFAKLVRGIDPSFTILHFADELKRQCGVVFGLTDAQMHDPAFKEVPFEKTIFSFLKMRITKRAPIVMDDYLDKMREASGINIQPRGIVAESPRVIMQAYGTEYVRSVQDNYWIVKLKEKALEVGGKILVPDTRFINEELVIRELGGQVLRVVRERKTSDKTSLHASETEQLRIKADLTVYNDGPIEDLAEIAGAFVVSTGVRK